SYLGLNLASERWGIAFGAYAQAAAAVRFAKEYVQDRTVFGKTVASFQNTKFELAACQAEVDAAPAGVSSFASRASRARLTTAWGVSAKL
ncbi:acyl-CoA dehydrogenase family protein, partial [Streptomyces beijiangensis]|uniref:acyl-CoA dehydrogenase family protein n=1 Tax=Streptomyces beijiangensis TaxID=163361 RepID=UPI0024141F7A